MAGQRNPAYGHKPSSSSRVAPSSTVSMDSRSSAGAASPAASKSPKKGGEDKPPGCIKKCSKRWTIFSRSACGASIIAIVKIVLAINSITGVWRSFDGAWCAPRAVAGMVRSHAASLPSTSCSVTRALHLLLHHFPPPPPDSQL